ncbi:hypothetical protein KUV74_12610 [Halomonas sp. DP1Y21-3]|uniref:hypothetical protein n=1 Tax=Halomonas sp. DP1Y21-3 TaxID=2859080 RepID=UPI001C988CE8|nr:hypothetical protein [Halomonas sp. DP1Y21-3]MBY6111236.1 hypothetical protein [Halomonas sp. DP1Y21-3]
MLIRSLCSVSVISLALLFSASALSSDAEEEHRESMDKRAAQTQPGEGMMEKHNEGMMEGSDAATERRQEMMVEPTDPSSTEGALKDQSDDAMEGSDALNEKRGEILQEQDG